ncbi:MAG: uncharacterized protein QOD92_861 [Acidimicrobiaceae bacterium]|jgi:uncharacterized membrane protein YfcA
MLAILVVGFASGILSGMFGVGGAVLTTPGVRALGASPLEAVGSTLPAILPGALSGAWRYSRERLVDWHVALPSGLLGSGFAVAGAELSDHVDAHYLMIATAGLLLYTGLRNVREHVAAPAARHTPMLVTVGGDGGAVESPLDALDVASAERTDAPIAIVGLIGAAAGLLAGLLGVGGGLLLLPAYTAWLRMSPKRAVGTSLVAVAMFSVPAMITHALLGHINWTYALLLTVGVVPGAQFGAKLTIGGSETRLRLLMGLFFTLLAVVYGASELLSV